MNKVNKYIFLLITLVSLTACRVPFTPSPITAATNYLVVEGLINITDSTYINLSRTVTVASKSTVKPELKAAIIIQSSLGSSYPLKELGNGIYAAEPLSLSAANQYRLMIKTANGNTYASDFVQAKIAPPIDTVTTQLQVDGVHIAVNAHDSQDNTRYYRWDYKETWEFNSFFTSLYSFNGLAIIPRTSANEINHCWGNFNSATILLASTANLSQDVISNNPITYVESSSEKLEIRYSILVKQYALTKDGYDYWTMLKKNTEQLGSIFDSQPTASIGNLHNVNNQAEPVIGFISAGTVSQTRIYIDHTTLPKNYFQDYLNTALYTQYTCVKAVVKTAEYNAYYNISNPILIPVDANTGATPLCVDCTIRGSNIQPSFWKY